jgi:hypothetical protein
LSACEEIIRSFQEVWKDFSESFLACWRRFKRGERFTKESLMAKQTKITIETDSLLILQRGNSTHARCQRCAAEGEMIALEKTGMISGLPKPFLEEWLNSEDLHRSETADGSLLICLNSLLAHVRNRKRR